MSVAPYWPALVVAGAALGWLLLRVVRGARDRATLRRLGAMVLVLVMALRPAFGTTKVEAQVSDLDVVLLVDRTLSMAAEDYDGTKTRMTGVKADITRLTSTYAGARFAVMTFTHQAYLEVAFTTDTAAVQSFIDVIRPVEQYYGAGSRIDVAREAAIELVERAATQQPDRRRVVIYLGDGEQTSSEPVKSFAELKPYLSGAMVLGYGTEQGGKMRPRAGSTSYVYDYKAHADALSKLDEGNLKAIAEQLGGTYERRTSPGQALTVNVREGSRGGQVAGPMTARNDVTWALALLLLGPVLWELWETATSARATRRLVRGMAS